MEKEITLPRLGETMEKGNISKWLIKEDETFERGQTIAEIESDKTNECANISTTDCGYKSCNVHRNAFQSTPS